MSMIIQNIMKMFRIIKNIREMFRIIKNVIEMSMIIQRIMEMSRIVKKYRGNVYDHILNMRGMSRIIPKMWEMSRIMLSISGVSRKRKHISECPRSYKCSRNVRYKEEMSRIMQNMRVMFRIIKTNWGKCPGSYKVLGKCPGSYKV